MKTRRNEQGLRSAHPRRVRNEPTRAGMVDTKECPASAGARKIEAGACALFGSGVAYIAALFFSEFADLPVKSLEKSITDAVFGGFLVVYALVRVLRQGVGNKEPETPVAKSSRSEAGTPLHVGSKND
jgi:hypothetical protein